MIIMVRTASNEQSSLLPFFPGQHRACVLHLLVNMISTVLQFSTQATFGAISDQYLAFVRSKTLKYLGLLLTQHRKAGSKVSSMTIPVVRAAGKTDSDSMRGGRSISNSTTFYWIPAP